MSVIDTIQVRNQQGTEESHPIGAKAENVIYNASVASSADSVNTKIKETDAHIAKEAVSDEDGVHGLRYKNDVFEVKNSVGQQVTAGGGGGEGDMTKEEFVDPSTGLIKVSKGGTGSATGNIDVSKITGILPVSKGGTGNTKGYVQIGSKPSVTIGNYSTAEGAQNEVTATYSHAEGYNNTCSGNYSHTEGSYCIIPGGASYSHAEGQNNKIIASSSSLYGVHVEGSSTTASGNAAHTEGQYTCAQGNGTHAEGSNTTAKGSHSHAEGAHTYAAGDGSHAEGGYPMGATSLNLEGTRAIGTNSHAEGLLTCAVGAGSHAEGGALNPSTSTIGGGTQAVGIDSHSEGFKTCAVGNGSHAEGGYNSAVSTSNENFGTYAIGMSSHSEGVKTTAHGSCSHAEGINTYAKGEASHAEGSYTTAGYNYQHVQGKYNDNKQTTVFEIGNGTSNANKKNVFEVYQNGAISTDNGICKIRFGKDSNGNYGYIKDGADTVTPFNSLNGTLLYEGDITDRVSEEGSLGNDHALYAGNDFEGKDYNAYKIEYSVVANSGGTVYFEESMITSKQVIQSSSQRSIHYRLGLGATAAQLYGSLLLGVNNMSGTGTSTTGYAIGEEFMNNPSTVTTEQQQRDLCTNRGITFKSQGSGIGTAGIPDGILMEPKTKIDTGSASTRKVIANSASPGPVRNNIILQQVTGDTSPSEHIHLKIYGIKI